MHARDGESELTRREFLERGMQVAGTAWAMPKIASFAVADDGTGRIATVELTPGTTTDTG